MLAIILLSLIPTMLPQAPTPPWVVYDFVNEEEGVVEIVYQVQRYRDRPFLLTAQTYYMTEAEALKEANKRNRHELPISPTP